MLLMEFFTVSCFDFNGCDFNDTLKTSLPERIFLFFFQFIFLTKAVLLKLKVVKSKKQELQ